MSTVTNRSKYATTTPTPARPSGGRAHQTETEQLTDFDHAVADSLQEALDRVLDDHLGAQSPEENDSRTARLLNALGLADH